MDNNAPEGGRSTVSQGQMHEDGPDHALRKKPQYFFPEGDVADDMSDTASDVFDRLEHELPSVHAGKRRWLVGVLGALVLSVAAGVGIYMLAPRRVVRTTRSVWEEACSVLCMGRILETVQSARLSADSKTFVDMPMVVDPQDIVEAFEVAFGDVSANPPTREQLAFFVSQYFYVAGSDTVPHVPADWQASPPQLTGIGNGTLREWALGLNDLWLQLGRRIIPSVRDYQQRFSLIWQPYPMIVPGGRFLESYYWDSYWIVLGLIQSGMLETAHGLVGNLVHLADSFGFVPNGGRVYYVLPGRSQPPLLSSMVVDLWRANGNVTVLERSYAALQREYTWFMGSARDYGHAVLIMEPPRAPDATGGSNGSAPGPGPAPRPHAHILNRFVTDQHIPRPESWYEDVHTAASAGHGKDSPAAQILYSEIAAAAESGFDFSARWFGDGANINTCETSHVVPVELNAMMHKVETDLSAIAGALAETAAQCASDATAALQGRRAAEELGGAERLEVGADGAIRMPTPAAPLYAPAPVPSLPRGGAHPHGVTPLCASLLRRYGNASVEAAPLTALPLLYSGLAGRFRFESTRYAEAADDRHEAIERLLWDEQAGRWRDLRISAEALPYAEPVGAPGTPHLVVNRCGVPVGRAVASRYAPRTDLQLGVNVHRGPVVSATDWLPLWSGSYCSRCDGSAAAARVQRVTASLNASGLVAIGGVASTMARTHEQWDHPNGWAPLNWMLSVGLETAGREQGVPLARGLGVEIARRWLLSCLHGYRSAGVMFEKMSVLTLGRGGGGGEYEVVTGFGWTNGAALDLLTRLGFAHLEPDLERPLTSVNASSAGPGPGTAWK